MAEVQKNERMLIMTLFHRKPEVFALLASLYYSVMHKITDIWSFHGLMEVTKGLTVVLSFMIALVSFYVLIKKNFKRLKKFPFIRYREKK